MFGEYRVWCENRKEWEKDVCAILPNGTLIHGLDSKRNSVRIIPVNPEKHIVEFCSQEKDLDGNKLYAGDIIKFSSDWDEHIVVIEYYDGAFRFGKQIKGDLGINDDQPIADFCTAAGCVGFHKIGNIHENQELL